MSTFMIWRKGKQFASRVEAHKVTFKERMVIFTAEDGTFIRAWPVDQIKEVGVEVENDN